MNTAVCFVFKRKKFIVFTVLFGVVGVLLCAISFIPAVHKYLVEYGMAIVHHHPKAQALLLNRLLSITAAIGIFIFAALVIFVIFKRAIQAFCFEHWQALLIAVVSVCAIAIRIPAFNFASMDYTAYIESWITYLKANGNLAGLAALDADYQSPYLFLISLISYLPWAVIPAAIKLLSCAFDFLCAVAAWKIVCRVTHASTRIHGLYAYCTVLFLPTVIMNGGLWGQCDSIYTAFCLWMLLSFLDNKPKRALALFGIAVAFKLQAIFLLPFIIFLLVYRLWNGRLLPISIISFFAAFVPGWIAGRPLYDWIITLAKEISRPTDLTSNAPNLCAWIHNGKELNFMISMMLVVFVIAMLGTLFFFMVGKNKGKQNLPAQTILLLFLFCSLALPFFLPHMHERYFYIAELAAVIYAFAVPSRWYLPFLIIFPSCSTYSEFLFGKGIVPLHHLVFPMCIALILVSKWLFKDLRSVSPRAAAK
ncbi:hypothetical protein FACS1894190_15300 [Spirochaetia bacterium]|nr:hypothetical protein FACS1894190_15300 [Spirochaetia bacterium]